MDDESGNFVSDPKLTFSHPYPPTKLMFIPDKEGSKPDLLATTGDHLRVWRIEEDGVMLDRLLTNVSARLHSLLCILMHGVCCGHAAMPACFVALPAIWSSWMRLHHAAAAASTTSAGHRHSSCYKHDWLDLMQHLGRCAAQNKQSQYAAPLTSFDWNETDPKRLGTSSIDTTCTIWDIEVS